MWNNRVLTVEDGVTTVHTQRVLKFILPVSAVCILSSYINRDNARINGLQTRESAIHR